MLSHFGKVRTQSGALALTLTLILTLTQTLTLTLNLNLHLALTLTLADLKPKRNQVRKQFWNLPDGVQMQKKMLQELLTGRQGKKKRKPSKDQTDLWEVICPC